MAAICENFVQNAWRKDLCSNCFKLRQDHHVCSKAIDTYNDKYIQQAYHSISDTARMQNSTQWRGLSLQKNFVQSGFFVNGLNSEPEISTNGNSNGYEEEKFQVVPTGILRIGQRKSSTGSVGFREEDPQIIGYGGDSVIADRDSEDEESDQFEDCDSLDNFDFTEEDKEFMKLTERNTEYNSIHCNLLAPSVEEKSPTVAKINGEGGSPACAEKEVVSKSVDEEPSGGNRFQLPRAAIRPFCRDSVSAILDAKATTPAPEVQFDEDGHLVVNEMNARNAEDREVVAYEVSPVSKIAPENFHLMFTPDVPPELPANPPPNEQEQPLGNSVHKTKTGESYYCSTPIVFDASDPRSPTRDRESTNGADIPVKIKPFVPSKPKSKTLECSGTNSDSDSVSTKSSEEIYQDTRDVFQDLDDRKELSFKDKVACLSSNLDFNRKNTKRQAPLPPPQPNETEEKVAAVDATTPNAQMAVILRNPPIRRINSTSDSDEQDQILSPTKPISPPVPRKPTNAKLRSCHSLDVSSARILATPMPEDNNKKLKGKFSLKKLLKFGKDGEDTVKKSTYMGTALEKRIKLEIIHPMDLANMSPTNPTSPCGDWDSPLVGEAGTFAYINEDKLMSQPHGSPKSPSVGVTRVKPPPPPRIKNETGAQMKPLRPPPPFKGCNDSSATPTSQEINRNRVETHVDSVPSAGGEYANLGEVRVILAPKKPERNSPASIRKEKQDLVGSSEDEDKLSVNDGKKDRSPEHLYCEPPDSLTSSVTEDEVSGTSKGSTSPTATRVSRYSRNVKAVGMIFPDSGFAETSSTESDAGSISSDGNSCSPKVQLSNLYAEVNKSAKIRQIVPKTALEDVAPPLPPAPLTRTNDNSSTDGEESSSQATTTSLRDSVTKLENKKWKKSWSLRANCSGIRGTIEENYNALVTANHEALAKIVEQLSTEKTSTHFDDLRQTPSRWTDFKVESPPILKLQSTAFYSAIWGRNTQVLLLVSEDIFPSPYPSKAPFLLNPLNTFQDFIPLDLKSDISKLNHTLIWVLEPKNVQTFDHFCSKLNILLAENAQNYVNLITFLLLQFVSLLKHLQQNGVEEVGEPRDWLVIMGDQYEDCTNLSINLIGSSTNSFPHPDAKSYSLCACAVHVMRHLLTHWDENDVTLIPNENTIFRVVSAILENEKMSSLTQAKAILEFSLFGPKMDPKNHENALQKWLDLEKAFALNNLIGCDRLTVFQYFHLKFLTASNGRLLRDALSSLTCSKA